MDVILDSKETADPDLKVFTENRVKFSLIRLYWLVRKIKVKYAVLPQPKSQCKHICLIELQTFDHQQIEFSATARDRRVALDMGLKRAYKHVQKVFHKAQKYGRLSKNAYV